MRLPSGKDLPSVTSAPAPTMLSAPMRAPFMTMAPMPIRLFGPTVQPCTTARCPMVQPSPMTRGKPMSVWSTAPSCTLVRAPSVIGSRSPRTAAPNQMPTSSPTSTCPTTCASGATKNRSAAGRRGEWSPSA